MRIEDTGMDRKILDNMYETAVIPPETEEKLAGVYDEIRRRCKAVTDRQTSAVEASGELEWIDIRRMRTEKSMEEKSGEDEGITGRYTDRTAEKTAGKSAGRITGKITDMPVYRTSDRTRSKNTDKTANREMGYMRKNMEAENRKTKRSRKRFLGVVTAAAIMAMSGIGVFAATHYFEKNMAQEENLVTYSFELNYELQPVEVTAVPGYLPEGFLDDGGGKYYPQDQYGHGISIIPINTINLAEMKGQMSFENVEKVEKTVIQGMEAHMVLYREAEKYRSGENLYLFNPQSGYVLWLYGDYNVSPEELQKVAENLDISVTPAKDSLAAAVDRQEDLMESDVLAVPTQIRPEEITALGEELDCQASGCGFTVLSAQSYDSILDVPGYTEAGAERPEELKRWLNQDGTHKSYVRTHYSENGEILGEEQATPKFLAVTVSARQYGESVWGSTFMDASLVRAVKNGDGSLQKAQDFYFPLPDQEYELQLDMRCFYMSEAENAQNEKGFFNKTLQSGDSVTYTMIFAVDSDLLEKENEELLMIFNATGNDTEAPLYSALEK